MSKISNLYNDLSPARELTSNSPLTQKKFLALYGAVNKMLAVLGAEGEITPRHETVTDVMDALHDIDGGEYRP